MSGTARASRRPRLTLGHDPDGSVSVAYDGQQLATYVYAPDDAQLESPRPYFHPIYTRSGALLTSFRPHDHVWHKGIAWSLPCVGPHNFWGGPTYVHGQGYVQLENDGSMDHQRFTTLDVTDEAARIAHDLSWRAQPRTGQEKGQDVVEERRTVVVTVPSDEAWVLTFSSTIVNVSGEPLDIGSPTTKGRENAGYGGLFWRGPRAFAGGTILAPGTTGGEELRGRRAEWMGFTALHDTTERSSTLVVVDDPTNPRHPPQWFVRSEQFACVNPAPFFGEELRLPSGGALTFRYAVTVADGGADPRRAERYAELGRAALRCVGATGTES